MSRISRLSAICLVLVGRAFAASLVSDGITAFQSGRYSTALTELSAAAAAHPDDVTAQVFLALTQAARNDCAAALPALKKNLGSQDPALARLAGVAAAKCEEASGDNTAAFEILNRLTRRFPNDADVLYTLAKLHMRAFDDMTYQMFQRVPSSYRVHQLSAEIFEVQGRFDEADDEYRKAIAANASAPDLHYQLGRAVLMRSHSPEALHEAEQAFQAELKLSPEDAASEYQLGQIAAVENQAETARTHFERALSFSPGFAEAMIELAKIDRQAKRYSQAIALLRKATAIQPKNEAAHYALMMTYRDSGQIAQAKEEKAALDRLQRPPDGEFTQFLKKLGEKTPPQ